MLAEGARKAVEDGAHEVGEEGPFAGLDIDVRRHAGRRLEAVDLAAHVSLVERDANHE